MAGSQVKVRGEGHGPNLTLVAVLFDKIINNNNYGKKPTLI